MHAAAEARRAGEEVPHLADGWESQGLRLTPSEGFLLSRIDGTTSWAELRQIAGMPPEQVDACLERWIAQGIVAVAPGTAAGASAAAPGSEPPRADPLARPELDPSLDLPIELQHRILAMEAELERPYHELLGVAPDADLRSIKRAFFALSKQFHPDRYFRRNVGPFGPRLAHVFKRIALAYEMLADPASRAEVERQRPAQASPAPEPVAADAAASVGGPAPAGRRRSRRRETLDRLRRHFRIPEEVLAERRFKARRFREAARAAAAQAKLGEAAAAIRLAIAFDPWSDEYKEAFAQIQSELQQQRAAELLERAGASPGSSGAEALRLLEEAIHYRPSDARLHHRAAELALELGEVERAREYAERACELGPEVAAHHTALGRVLRRVGERALARAAFERAHRLDPADARASEELDRLRRRRAAQPGRGGSR
jgi:curved DNA-binding protein CbpA